ncbi:N-acetyltransferase family protein [Providencia rettgeri]|uniref:GNAT family N-acetyltransferase n=1 Tax=Providencia sp. TaxID=589 RepID=UPI0024ABD490|nr:GNAT family N-acetyltransferase [Providencia rettgeri]
MTEPKIRLLELADAQDFRDIRLSALKESPEMFGSTYACEEKLSIEVFEARLRDAMVFGAYIDKEIVGLSVLKQDGGPKDAHKAYLSGVFVAPEQRGHGIAEKLLLAVKRYANEHMEQIMLTVVDGNKAAISLYEKHGFKIYGVEPRALKEGTEYRDEILMALILR